MKTFKRNAVIITVVLFVCAAAYLNWSYNRGDDAGNMEEGASAGVQDGAVGEDIPVEGELFYTLERTPVAGASEDAGASADFFSMTRINRKQARDAAVETLAAVNASEGASQEIIDEAMSKLTGIAGSSEKEAEVESLILAKGFDDCVVFISEDGVKVTVPAPMEGLSSVDVARITDIITSETDYEASSLQIIEVK
ncbi:MAG: SpoIIIAH-like family protein [Oscillospiraceae bacterium]|nr:SpoIIIAH-like family protein [Oscillospiraceae bacterium]